MDGLWPWLAVAGSGMLHGCNPFTGWMCAAAWAVHSGASTRVWRALLPLALGHLAAIAVVAGAAALAVPLGPAPPLAAGALLLAGAITHRSGRGALLMRIPAGHAGLALWAFMMASLHGAGLALAPVLVSLCLSPGQGAAPAMAFALGGVLVHMAGMLAATWLLAWAASRRAMRSPSGGGTYPSTNRFCAGKQCRSRS